ncbi:ATP-binding protein [Pedobacter sp.]|jgi:AAA15 family ATPase/GTPase|uniref:AAA family ATPase n=1 Tax=Pedobacter sp. TaxID=1411316 RepID=UPI002C63BB01|nr:ATP-binding protein [Pedobacter sp.]HWW42241.1 ATP-binding protein [Pedobacter sp.]
MLVYFKVGNFKSIKDPILINFAATAINEHEETNVFEKGKDRLLKTVLMYGANAGGKSKILDAFKVYKDMILLSTNFNSTRNIPVEPFLLNEETRTAPSFFEAEFIIKNKKYRYGFEANEKEVSKEWLLEVKATTQVPLYLRIGQKFQIDHKKFINAKDLESRCNTNVLFLSVADQWNVPVAKTIYAWFDSIDTIEGLSDSGYRSDTNEMMRNFNYNFLINEMIRKADLGIKSINVGESPTDTNAYVNIQGMTDKKMKSYLEAKLTPILTMHNVFDNNGKVINEITFDLEKQGSEGTKKFYNIIGVLLRAVIENRLVIFDEIDARIHTLLTKSIIRLFNGTEVKTEAQLLAACHDTAVMDRDLLRRDQIYLVEKNNLAATTVVNLVEYKVRKETPFDKNYLDGKYGGIPFIENLENILKDGQ